MTTKVGNGHQIVFATDCRTHLQDIPHPSQPPAKGGGFTLPSIRALCPQKKENHTSENGIEYQSSECMITLGFGIPAHCIFFLKCASGCIFEIACESTTNGSLVLKPYIYISLQNT